MAVVNFEGRLEGTSSKLSPSSSERSLATCGRRAHTQTGLAELFRPLPTAVNCEMRRTTVYPWSIRRNGSIAGSCPLTPTSTCTHYDVPFGYTPACRSVTKLPFRTLWDGGAYGPVAVTRGGSQGGRCVRLRCHQLVQQSQDCSVHGVVRSVSRMRSMIRSAAFWRCGDGMRVLPMTSFTHRPSAARSARV